MINREEMNKRAQAKLGTGKWYADPWGGPNPTLKVTAGKKTFCLCEEHFVKFNGGVKRGELRFQGVPELQGNWARTQNSSHK